jgi:dephospho-CoA kinase
MRIGITGGVCSGKSTALKVFEAIGFDTVDLESYIRDALQGNERVKKGIHEQFGKECFDPDGSISLDRLIGSVNANHKSIGDFDTLIYPEIESLWHKDRRIPTVVEVPLLFEKNLDDHFDFTICIYCSYAMQLARGMLLRNWTKERLDTLIINQYSVDEKMRYANYVIGNNGNMLQFYRQVRHFIEDSNLMENILK